MRGWGRIERENEKPNRQAQDSNHIQPGGSPAPLTTYQHLGRGSSTTYLVRSLNCLQPFNILEPV